MTTHLLSRVKRLWEEDSGFLVSAELVIIATLLVIGLVVGLAEVQNAVVGELNDVSEAIGSMNQTFYFHGHRSWSGFGGVCGLGGACGFGGGLKSYTPGSAFIDNTDAGDRNECAISCFGAEAEIPKGASCASVITSGVPGGGTTSQGPNADCAGGAVPGVQLHPGVQPGDSLHGGTPGCAVIKP